MDISTIYHSQQKFFNTNQTKSIDFRIEQLKKLKKLLESHERELLDSIYKDFKKSAFDTYITELYQIYHEINLCVKKLNLWSRPKRVKSRRINFPSRAYIYTEPLGVVLVIGAWNYPYLLALKPVVSAIAAGNTVILKPSELTSECANMLAKIINNNFEDGYFYVQEGGVSETQELLKYRFDKIFFTGSTQVGKLIYKAAAEQLTPVTLELGGKSPCIVLSDANINITAKRLVWAKFLNAGQTCVAPDYVIVHETIKEKLLEALKKEIETHYTNKVSENYTQIINQKNFDRLVGLIKEENVCHGGEINREERFISPTILDNIGFDHVLMQQEIFGPILPVLTFNSLRSVITTVKKYPKPLACYIYSNDVKSIKRILNQVSFGGGAINDSVVQLSNDTTPFGGVGMSGIGSYHGKYGFDNFSHKKSILHKVGWIELNLKYAPYSETKLKWIKRLFGV